MNGRWYIRALFVVSGFCQKYALEGLVVVPEKPIILNLLVSQSAQNNGHDTPWVEAKPDECQNLTRVELDISVIT